MKRALVLAGGVVIAAALLFAGFRTRETPKTPTSAASSLVSGSELPLPSSTATPASLPHAVHDQAKRDALRARLVAAMAEAKAKAASAASSPAAPPGLGSAPAADPRGNRETNDLKEFGRFVQQAIQDDFLPMAKACATELHARAPKASGSATIRFKLLGDQKIGGVVDRAEVDAKKSTLHDETFETCIRESLYGVYFDPPPAGGEATLDFPITLLEDGGVADDVDDFSHIRDRRNEK